MTASFLSAACLCAGGGHQPPRGARVARLAARLASGEIFAATLAGARIEAGAAAVRVLRDAGETTRGGLAPVPLAPDRASIWDGRFELTPNQAPGEGWEVRPLKGLAAALSPGERAEIGGVPAAARPALPVVLRGLASSPVLATKAAMVRCLVGPRLAAACGVVAHEGEIVDLTRGAGATASLC